MKLSLKNLIPLGIALSIVLIPACTSAKDADKNLYQEENSDREITYRAPQVDVIGAGSDALIDIPGSGVVKDQKTLTLEQPVSVQQAVRNIPGVNIRGEDSAGLVPNIGI
ncbi:MAG: hypothetical protein R3257_05040, partial [bacterium]|nr:hypothetical protein [bacterium]